MKYPGVTGTPIQQCRGGAGRQSGGVGDNAANASRRAAEKVSTPQRRRAIGLGVVLKIVVRFGGHKELSVRDCQLTYRPSQSLQTIRKEDRQACTASIGQEGQREGLGLRLREM